MMDSPFFRSRWNLPSRTRGIPVQQQTKPSPKVVSIPVHFIGSERSRSEAAVEIQKVFRGFLVRKSMKKIAAISREVEEIEKKISKEESVELIRRDSKERLKVNEMLMSLLFRLDSVRGVDSGVRDCRKKVIKKAIALQEMVDAIVADHNAEIVAEAVDQAVEIKELEVPDLQNNCCGADAIDESVDENQGNVEEKQIIVENDNATPFVSECGEDESVGTNSSAEEQTKEGCAGGE